MVSYIARVAALPEELLIMVFKHLNKKDALSLNLQCRLLQGVVNECLDAQDVRIFTFGEKTVERLDNIWKSRITAVRFAPIRFNHGDCVQEICSQVLAFPKINTVVLDLSRTPADRRFSPYPDPACTIEHFFNNICKMPHRRYPESDEAAVDLPQPPTNIKHLELFQVPTVGKGHYRDLRGMGEVMKDLSRTLRALARALSLDLESLSIDFKHWFPSRTREDADYPTDGDQHHFAADVVPLWLSKVQSLKQFRLNFEEHFGLYPRLRLDNHLHLHLTHLSLSKLFLVDGTLAWISRHKTLRHLTLLSCAIASRIITHQTVGPALQILRTRAHTPQAYVQTFRWWHVLDHLRVTLSNLCRFELGELKREQRLKELDRPAEERYRVYNQGYTQVDYKMHNGCLGADAAALVALWRHTGQREEAERLAQWCSYMRGYRDYVWATDPEAAAEFVEESEDAAMEELVWSDDEVEEDLERLCVEESGLGSEAEEDEEL